MITNCCLQCTFGILKGRWRILKTGVRLHKSESVDMIWKTCCAFHNMLLKIDGLDKPWDGVNAPHSNYEGRLGDLEFTDMPVSMQRLYSPSEARAYNVSATADAAVRAQRPLVVQGESSNIGMKDYHYADNEVRVVCKLSLNYFRSRLVEHFDILFHDGKVVWPRSRCMQPRTI